ncbi:hypothetical protein D3C83_203350 [compost metagenome]
MAEGGPKTPCFTPSIAPSEWWATDWIWKRNGNMSAMMRASTISLGSMPLVVKWA